ncbi:putative dehydrin [Helianthus annuus]|nr:putative dehydrin [Helianthus annuus]KAJ0721531.1 putative dehydrin [Helianthus annuus]
MSNEAVYHDAPKTEEPCETTTTTVKVEPEVVEQSDRGLFGFGKKDEEEKKCEDGVISSEFEQKVQVTEPEPEEKKGSLLEKFHRSNSSSSSSSDEECEDGEKKVNIRRRRVYLRRLKRKSQGIIPRVKKRKKKRK